MPTVYYIAKVFLNNPRYEGSCLIPNSGNKKQPWGTTNPKAHAHRFRREEDALEALKVFFATGIQEFWTSGQVHRVTEEPVGLVIEAEGSWGGPSEPPESAPEAPCEPETDEVGPEVEGLDLGRGEALLADAVRHPKDDSKQAELQIWLYEHADLLLSMARERNRLTWLRQHPEACRAKHDCRAPRKEGFIFCEECVEEGVGGYFDVYQRYWVEKYNAEMEKANEHIEREMERVNSQIREFADRFRLAPSNLPEESDPPPGPGSPQAPPTCPA